MDYVIRNKNVYIKRNNNGAPITCSRNDAEKFEYSKAKNLLSSLPKNLKKFHFRLEPVSEIKRKKENMEVQVEKSQKIIEVSKVIPDSITRWVTKVEDLNGIGKEASDRLKVLNRELLQIEHMKLDLLHEIELSSRVNACDGYKKFRELKTLLEKRREIKDEKIIVKTVLNSNVGQIAADRIRKSIDGLKTRKYTYRSQD